MGDHGERHIVIAHPLAAEEALALLAEPAVDGADWFVSVRGLAEPVRRRPAPTAGEDRLASDLVTVLVTPESVRAARFDPIGRSVRAEPGPVDPGIS